MEIKGRDDNFLECYQETLNQMADTFYLKNERYGDSFTQTMDDYGLVTSIIRVTDKFNRMTTLFKNRELDEDDEPIVDTMLDMANYLAMTVAYLKSREQQQDTFEIVGGIPKESKTSYAIPPEHQDASKGSIIWSK